MSTSAYPQMAAAPPTLTPQRGISSLLLAALLLPLAVLGIASLSDSLWHWFLIPVTLCGILIGDDALDWIRGRVDIFDPVGIVGLLGLHFFWLAPLLHVYRDYWMPEVVPPPDWRDWLGYMAALNVTGLLVYRIARTISARTRKNPVPRTFWEIDTRRFWLPVTIALVVSAVLQFFIYAQYGGIIGYVTTIVAPGGLDAAQGMGWLFTLAESFPSFAIIAWAVYARNKTFARSWLVILLVLFVFFMLKILFGGLRGSRSNTVWGLLGAVGIIHFWVRPIPRKIILVGGVLVLAFMYAYGFFKAAGLEGLAALGDEDARNELVVQTGRNLDYLILADLGRSDVQAFVLYRLSQSDSDYEYAWGRTYVGGIVSVIPSVLWQNRPQTKIEAGTEALYGAGTFSAGDFWSSRQYGLAGEALLNFGPLGVPFAFLLLALVVIRIQELWLTLQPFDARWLLVPSLSIFCFVLVATDSDNLTLYFLKEIAIPAAILLFSVRVTEPSPVAPSDSLQISQT